MILNRQSGAAVGALILLVLASCTDSAVVSPDTAGGPSMAILDGSTGGSGEFYILPPLANGNPSISGEFNPNLLPAMRVCELIGDPGTVCANKPAAAWFPPGSADVGSGQYQISWDTDGPETSRMNANKFYRLEILVADSVMGWIELDPQNPNGPGQSVADAYAFRLGETIPVKFWLSTDVLCLGESFVTECITGAVIDETGGTLALEGEGAKLGVIIFQGGLPGVNADPITVTVERIDPDIYFAATGAKCLPLFDAPQFGDCFRVTTVPELTAPLDIPALVSICLDPGLLDGIDLSLEQQNQLTMVRFNDDGSDAWEALPDAAGDCPIQSASLLRVPSEGLFRYAAMGINALADLVAPEPLAARDIRLGGLTSSFSRFRYALPGQMIPTTGDSTVIQPADSDTLSATINVVDSEGLPVEDAIVHFATIDGTISAADIISDVDGNATVEWVVDRTTPGQKTLTASALGLLSDTVPEHNTAYFFTAASVDLTAIVVGPPANFTQAPTDNLDGTAGESVGDLTITVVDAAGNPISGADVTWDGDGGIVGGDTTGSDGSATGEWTLPTTAGESSVTATVGSQTATFTASGGAGAAVTPSYSLVPASGTAGYSLTDPVVVTLTDQYGNAREGDDVTWTIVLGSGSASAPTGSTASDGSAETFWTLGDAAGVNTLTASVAGFDSTFTVDGVAGAAVQPAGSGSGQTGVVDQQLATVLSVTVTDEFGNPIEGEIVVWSGDGIFQQDTDTTDVGGVATGAWKLGTLSGAQSASASAAGFTVGFTATATPGAATSLAQTGGGTAPVGSAIPLTLTVSDAFGNLRDGDAVTWTVTGGGGSVSGDATTAPDGSAAASWTLGATPGANTATGSVAGLQAMFAATGECFDGWGIANIDGTFGAEWACASSLDFDANISGGSTPATVYWMNDGSNIYMAVRVLQASLDKANSLRIDFDNDGNGSVDAGDDVIGYDADLAVALDMYLDRKCVNRSQSNCGSDDTSFDVGGAVMNDGSYTTYELSHPFGGDANGEDIMKYAGDALGFYLTLRSGNGAQGNTQVPGFRNYYPITIVGVGN